ncbi:hypothetical protein I7Z51_002408 [Vibrio parahaemolyticus]|uniref:hypothetical protein n=2 Tax=Vibrionaceae TaxID=641 RepID=UPI001A8D9F8E|nr:MULTISPECIES: hypothetical protein [Vibrio]EGQ7973486.1 hypothetical protein [Vibrio parahaemolyticus]MBO0208612.1 hypothetical protein [Vibrio sp. Vb0877]MCR9810925.1 hypothetical protein [Vibrio parahaemolyticus]
MSNERLEVLKLISDSIQHSDDGLSKKEKALMIFKTYCKTLQFDIIDIEHKKNLKTKPSFKLLDSDGMSCGVVCKETFKILDGTRVSEFDRYVYGAIGCLYQGIDEPAMTVTNNDHSVEERTIKTMTKILLAIGYPIENIKAYSRRHEGYKVDIAQQEGLDYTPEQFTRWGLWIPLIAAGVIGLWLLSL